MARPTKQGIDYFPLDVYLDDKFKFIEIKYGLEGFGIVVRLLQKIYSQGYWCKWSDDEALLFSNEIRADIESVNGVVSECLKRDLFHAELYEKHGILTSKGIQKRYKEATRRRKEIEVIEDYVLIGDMLPEKCKQNDGNNTDYGQQSDGESTQSKVNKSKGDQSKEKDKRNEEEEARAQDPFDFYEQNGFGILPPLVREEICQWLDGNYFDEPKPVIVEAMKEAVRNDKKNWSYVNRILYNWSDHQVKTLKDAAINIEQWRDKKKRRGNKQPRRVEPVPKWDKPKELTPEEQAEWEQRKKQLEAELKEL